MDDGAQKKIKKQGGVKKARGGDGEFGDFVSPERSALPLIGTSLKSNENDIFCSRSFRRRTLQKGPSTIHNTFNLYSEGLLSIIYEM